MSAALYSCGGFAVSADRNVPAAPGVSGALPARSADYQHPVKIHVFHTMEQWIEVLPASLNFIDVSEEYVTFTGKMGRFPPDINYTGGSDIGLRVPRWVIKGIEFDLNFHDPYFSGKGVTAIIESKGKELRYANLKGLRLEENGSVLRCYYNKGGSRADFKKGDFDSFFVDIK